MLAVHTPVNSAQEAALGPLRSYGTITTGTGQWRARATATEPSKRWLAREELPTTIATVSSG
jgi:hypothetical protein